MGENRWPACEGQVFFTLVSNGTIETCTLGWALNCAISCFKARTRPGSVMPGGMIAWTVACSQNPVCSWEPGGSETHMLPDSSTTSITFTGKPVGSGGAVQTLPFSVKRSLALDVSCAGGSKDASVHEDKSP